MLGFASSNSEAGAKLKGGAVAFDGTTIGESNFIADMPLDYHVLVRVGRRMKNVRLVE